MVQEPQNFLVRVGDMFFAGFNKKWQPQVVATPSTAAHMTYAKADAICQHLIGIKYERVCVTDRYGQYADLDVIQKELQQ